jgi:hypothetical protein
MLRFLSPAFLLSYQPYHLLRGYVLIETDPLRSIAKPLEDIGNAFFSQAHANRELRDLGADLLETAYRFGTLREDTYIWTENYSPSERRLLIENFSNLAMISEAGVSAGARSTQLLQDIGNAVEELNLKEACSQAFKVLGSIREEIQAEFTGGS